MITGRQVFVVTAGAFGLIVAVNVTMAVQAVRTFPGLEVKNSYVASQSFDRERRAQEALGWRVEASVAEGALRVAIDGPDGRPAAPKAVAARVGRATERNDDIAPVLAFDGRAWTAPVALAPGYWNLWLDAVAEDGTAFRQRLELYVK